MKNKGFTLVEILVTVVILALVSGIAIYSVNGMNEKAKISYYNTVKQELVTSASDFYQDNSKERPTYSSVSVSDLEKGNYITKIKDKNGKNGCTGSWLVSGHKVTCTCSGGGGTFAQGGSKTVNFGSTASFTYTFTPKDSNYESTSVTFSYRVVGKA